VAPLLVGVDAVGSLTPLESRDFTLDSCEWLINELFLLLGHGLVVVVSIGAATEAETTQCYTHWSATDTRPMEYSESPTEYKWSTREGGPSIPSSLCRAKSSNEWTDQMANRGDVK